MEALGSGRVLVRFAGGHVGYIVDDFALIHIRNLMLYLLAYVTALIFLCHLFWCCRD